MRLKRLAAALITCIMALSLMACEKDSQKEPSEDVPDNTVKDEEILQVGIWDVNQEEGIKEILAGFTDETGIETELLVMDEDEYWTKLSEVAQGGTFPDVFWVNPDEAVKCMQEEVLLDLTDKMEASDKISFDKYPAELWKLYEYDGKNFAVPKDIDTIALWYNKTMFDEVGIAYPDESWTWETLCKAAQEIVDKGVAEYGFYMSPDDYQEGYGNWIYSYGGYMMEYDPLKSGFDNPETINAMELLDTFLASGTMPSSDVMVNSSKMDMFASGKTAMVTMGSWRIDELENDEYVVENCDCTVLPMSSMTNTRACLYSGIGWAANANTDMPDEAWECIGYLGSEMTQQKGSEFNLQAYIDMRENIYIVPHSVNKADWEEKMNSIMKEVWDGNIEMNDGCQQIADVMNEIFENE